MSDPSGIVIESQLDWLTCAVHTGKGAERLQRLANLWAAQTEKRSNLVQPFRLKGYEGWQCGRVRLGTREGAAIVQLSGDLAARHYDTLIPMADNTSRIDIAVTAQLPAYDPDLGRRSFEQAQAFYSEKQRAARPEQHADGDGGYTCYVGRRTSDWFLRIYNKQAECADDPAEADHYRNCWRYELEVKGASAPVLFSSLAVPDEEQRSADIQQMLYEYVTRHGMTPAFPMSGGQHLIAGFRRRSDRQTKLDWLARTVKPAINWLQQNGDAADVYEALGLPFDSAAADSEDSADTKDKPDDAT